LQHGDSAVIKSGERLVEQQHGWIVEKSARHGQPLAHAAGKLAHQAAGYAVETGALQPLGGGLAGSRKP